MSPVAPWEVKELSVWNVRAAGHLCGVVHVSQVEAQGCVADAAERLSELGRRYNPALGDLSSRSILLAFSLCSLRVRLLACNPRSGRAQARKTSTDGKGIQT